MSRLLAGVFLASLLSIGSALSQTDAASENGLYWYEASGQAAGPVDASEIARLAQEGAVGAETLIWMEGLPAWRPVAEVDALAEILGISGLAYEPLEESGPLTLSRFLSTIDPMDSLHFEAVAEQEALFSRASRGWDALLLLDRDTPPIGDRRMAVTVEILDAQETPGRMVGAGIVYAFTGANDPFLAVLVSPDNGGVVHIVENLIDAGIAVNQTLGNNHTRVGAPVRLTLREAGGVLEVTFGESSMRLGNAITRAGEESGRLGVIFYGEGRYRLSDLEIGGGQG